MRIKSTTRFCINILENQYLRNTYEIFGSEVIDNRDRIANVTVQ